MTSSSIGSTPATEEICFTSGIPRCSSDLPVELHKNIRMHKAEQVECMGLHTCRIIILVGVCFLSIAARNLKSYYAV